MKKVQDIINLTGQIDIYKDMNEKMQAILLQIILQMKNDKWSVLPDWELTLKSEGHVPMTRKVPVEGTLNDREWRDTIDTSIDLKLSSSDQYTFFPEYTIYANIFINGGDSKDITYKMDADVAFTEQDIKNRDKIHLASSKISRLVENYIENEYSDYIDQNAQKIGDYDAGGWKADDDARDDR